MFMGVIIGDDKNKGVKIFTNDTKSGSLIFAFHGTPLTKNVAEALQQIETRTETKRKVYMPYTENSTSTMSHKRLVEEMDKYYQLVKDNLLKAKTIDVVAHSYGPVKALAFLHAIAKDKENAPKILAKVENLHLYNGMINMEWDSSHTFIHNIKLFIFRIRIFFMSLLRGEKDVETPDVVKSLIDLKSEAFKPTTFIAYNPEDAATPSSEPFMEKVRGDLKKAGVPCSVIDDSNLVQYNGINQHGTGAGLVRRFEEIEHKLDLKQRA